MSSKSIEDFLSFLRDAEQQYDMAVQNEKEANDATQDILHAVELDTYNPRKTSGLVKTLRTVRKSRRTAKETIETFSPVLSWLEEKPSYGQDLGTSARRCPKSGAAYREPYLLAQNQHYGGV